MDARDAQWWTGEVSLYDFDHIPLDRDIFLISAEQLEPLRQCWLKIQTEEGGPHPNESLNVTWCAVQEIAGDTCRLNVCIDMTTRYHGALHRLPRSKFVTCVHFWNYEKRPYLVVDAEWFAQIQREMYSLYALVDAIGVRAALERGDGIAPAAVVSYGFPLIDRATRHSRWATS